MKLRLHASVSYTDFEAGTEYHGPGCFDVPNKKAEQYLDREEWIEPLSPAEFYAGKEGDPLPAIDAGKVDDMLRELKSSVDEHIDSFDSRGNIREKKYDIVHALANRSIHITDSEEIQISETQAPMHEEGSEA